MSDRKTVLVKRSNCCNSEARVVHNPALPVFGSVNWHECQVCKKPCDVHIEEWVVDGIGGTDEATEDND